MRRADGVPPVDPQGADALAMCRRLRGDLGHARRVATHAAALFAACANHLRTDSLSSDDLLLRLSLAAWLHDIGKIVAVEEHQRHSRYLVENSSHTRQWDALLRADVGALCTVHRRRFRRKWRRTWLRDDPGLLQTAALLRIADALDRSHEVGVTIRAEMQSDGLYLQTYGLRQDDADRLLLRKADAFDAAFGRPLILVAASSPGEQ